MSVAVVKAGRPTREERMSVLLNGGVSFLRLIDPGEVMYDGFVQEIVRRRESNGILASWVAVVVDGEGNVFRVGGVLREDGSVVIRTLKCRDDEGCWDDLAVLPSKSLSEAFSSLGWAVSGSGVAASSEARETGLAGRSAPLWGADLFRLEENFLFCKVDGARGVLRGRFGDVCETYSRGADGRPCGVSVQARAEERGLRVAVTRSAVLHGAGDVSVVLRGATRNGGVVKAECLRDTAVGRVPSLGVAMDLVAALGRGLPVVKPSPVLKPAL